MKFFRNKFLRTFKDLFVNPQRVFQNNSSEYLGHWQFTLLLFGTTVFLGYFYNSIFSEVTYYSSAVSDRLAQFRSAFDNFNQDFEVSIELIKSGLVVLVFSYMLFKKARVEFKSFFAMMIYVLGIMNTIVFSLMFLDDISHPFHFHIPFVIIRYCGIAYLFYACIIFFKNPITTTVKLILLIVPSVLLYDNLLTPLADNSYIRLFHKDKIIHEYVETSLLKDSKKLVNGQAVISSTHPLDESSTLICNRRDGNYNFDIISDNGLLNIYKHQNLSIPVIVNDTVFAYTILGSNPTNKVVSSIVIPETNITDTISIHLFLRAIEPLNDERVVMLGRNAEKYPKAIILNRFTKSNDSLVLLQDEFKNHVFIHFREYADSLFLFTTCEFEDGFAIKYTMNLMNAHSKIVVKSTNVFERNNRYSFGLPSMEFVNDTTIIFGYIHPNDISDQLFLVSFNLQNFEKNWEKIIEITNDQMHKFDLKYYDESIYFTGHAHLYLHKYWLTDEKTYGFLGRIDLDGNLTSLEYLKESDYFHTALNGFFISNKNLFVLGNSYTDDGLLSKVLFRKNHFFQINVNDNLN